MKIKFAGINNIDDPARLKEDECVDICNCDTASSTGVAVMRQGFTNISTTPLHSLFSDGDSLYSVQSSKLCRNGKEILGLSNDNAMSMCLCDNKWIAFTNGTDIGFVVGGTAEPIDGIPPGKFVASCSGMVCVLAEIGEETWLLHTNPWDLSGIDMEENYLRWKGKATLLAATGDGVWVGAGDQISFVTFGEQHGERVIANYPAVPYTAQYAEARKLGLELGGTYAVVFATSQGICVGGESGTFINLSQNKVSLPQADSGAAIVKEQDGQITYVCNLLATGSEYNPRLTRPLDFI